MKNTGRTKRNRRHVRWDRIFMVLIVLIGIVGVIAIFIHAGSKKKNTVESTNKPNTSAKAYYQEAIAPDTDNAMPEAEAAEHALLSGADISKHNGEIITDGDFVIVKATEGVGYVDPRFEENIQNALNNNQLCGVYHYARPDSGNMPTVEAEHFVESIKPYLGRVMLVLDWEEEAEIDNTVWVAAWMWQVYQMTGVRPVLYTSASVAQDYDWTGISNQFDLWVACYVQDSADIPNGKIDDYDLSAWRTIIWQYSTAGELDRNVSSLTAEEWQNRCLSNDQKVAGTDLMETMHLMSLSAN